MVRFPPKKFTFFAWRKNIFSTKTNPSSEKITFLVSPHWSTQAMMNLQLIPISRSVPTVVIWSLQFQYRNVHFLFEPCWSQSYVSHVWTYLSMVSILNTGFWGEVGCMGHPTFLLLRLPSYLVLGCVWWSAYGAKKMYFSRSYLEFSIFS